MIKYNFVAKSNGLKVFPAKDGYSFKQALRLAWLCKQALKNPDIKQ